MLINIDLVLSVSLFLKKNVTRVLAGLGYSKICSAKHFSLSKPNTTTTTTTPFNWRYSILAVLPLLTQVDDEISLWIITHPQYIRSVRNNLQCRHMESLPGPDVLPDFPNLVIRYSLNVGHWPYRISVQSKSRSFKGSQLLSGVCRVLRGK